MPSTLGLKVPVTSAKVKTCHMSQHPLKVVITFINGYKANTKCRSYVYQCGKCAYSYDSYHAGDSVTSIKAGGRADALAENENA